MGSRKAPLQKPGGAGLFEPASGAVQRSPAGWRACLLPVAEGALREGGGGKVYCFLIV